MKRLLAFLMWVAVVLGALTGASAGDISEEVRAVLSEKVMAKAEVGIQIVRLGTNTENSTRLFKHNSDIPLIPASNLKVITTSAALDRLGQDFRFQTRLLYREGDLILLGDGDPSLGDAELLHKSGWDVNTTFKAWADRLKLLGIKSIKNVIVDDSVFDEHFVHVNWPADQLQKRYMAGVAGINLNANCVDFFITPNGAGQRVAYTTNPSTQFAKIVNTCVGGKENAVWLSRQPNSEEILLKGEASERNDKPISVTVLNPPLYAGTVLAETLRESGVEVVGTVTHDRTLRAALEQPVKPGDKRVNVVAVLETPLTTVIARANKDSMNLYAEALCKRMGFAGTGRAGSWESGTHEMGLFLKKAGVVEDQFNLDDGCGLSKQNHISADGMVRVLMYNYFSKNRETFLKTLSVAGVDGTLDDRFKGSDLRGRVFGKSGFVEGVSCLSGYLRGKDNTWYAFSILMNGIPKLSNSGIKPLQERIVKAIEK